MIPVRPPTLVKCITSLKSTMYDSWVAGGWFKGVVGIGLGLFVTPGGGMGRWKLAAGFHAQLLVAIGGLSALFLVYQCTATNHN